MANQNSELKNPIFWCIIMLLVGIGLGVWGWIKVDCIGPDCWKGSGLLMWSGGILIALALLGFFTIGNKK